MFWLFFSEGSYGFGMKEPLFIWSLDRMVTLTPLVLISFSHEIIKSYFIRGYAFFLAFLIHSVR